MRNICLLLLLVSSFQVIAQKPEKRLVQFSGLVLSSDSLQALPYSVIYDKSIGKGTYANYIGFFSFVATEGDSIYFSYIGYKKKLFVIPKDLMEEKYSIIQLLSYDTVNLAATIIRPYPRPEAFRQAFLDLKVQDDDLDRAKKNLQLMASKELRMNLQADGIEASNFNLRKNASTYYFKGQQPPQNIFNPLAWASFFEAWKRGDFKNKNNY